MIHVQPFIHPKALVDDDVAVGAGSRVWAFAHLVRGAIVGDDCNICDHTFIEGGVRIGNRVTIKCGVYLWDGIVAKDDVFIGPAAVFANDLRPRSKQYPPELAKTVLEQGCSIGANATILPGIRIGRWAMVGAGAVATRSVPDFALVVGNPARFVAWLCRCGKKLDFAQADSFQCPCGCGYIHNSDKSISQILP